MPRVQQSLLSQVCCILLLLSSFCCCIPVRGNSEHEILGQADPIETVSDQDDNIVPEDFVKAAIPERYEVPAMRTAVLSESDDPLVIGRAKHVPVNQLFDIVIQLVYLINAADVNDKSGSNKVLGSKDVDMSGVDMSGQGEAQQLLGTSADEEKKSWLAEYAPGFSKDEINEEFYLFDWNNDNHITAVELGKVMQELGFDPTAKMVLDIVHHFDKDKNGGITRGQEFFEMMLTRHGQHDAELDNDNMETFNLFDADGDKEISGSEIRLIYAKLEQREDDLPMSDLPDTDLDAMLQKCPSKLLLPIKFMDYCRLSMQFFVHAYKGDRIATLKEGQLDFDAEKDRDD